MSGPSPWGCHWAWALPAPWRVRHLHAGTGIGDTDIFDWGGLLSALIGTFIVLGLAGYFLRRRQPPATPPPASSLPGDEGPRPAEIGTPIGV